MNATLRTGWMSRFRTVLVVLLLLPFCAGVAWSQMITTDGVYIDGKGVLRSRKKADPRLSELRKKAARMKKDEELVYISLPRVFAEARKYQEEGKPLPDEVRYLGGITRLQYIFVYPEENDIVIAGRAEPFEKDMEFRPLGQYTGRPVLQLDDLVTALRACGPGRDSSFLGCDLEMTKDIVQRIRDKTKEIQRKIQSIGEERAREEIAAAGGTQPVKYFGVDTNTRFAIVCIEADYRLKQLQLGLMKSPTRKVKTYMDMAGKPEKPHRFALESAYDALAVSEDGNAFELKGPSLKVVCTLFSVDRQAAKEGKISIAAAKFRDQCNENFEELSGLMPSWCDLSNLSDLAVLAALIGEDKLHEKVGWDLSWVMDRKGYGVASLSAPKSVQTLCNSRHYGQQIIFASGGVGLTPGACVKNRARDEKGALGGMSERPQGEAWCSSRKIR